MIDCKEIITSRKNYWPNKHLFYDTNFVKCSYVYLKHYCRIGKYLLLKNLLKIHQMFFFHLNLEEVSIFYFNFYVNNGNPE